jgi:hypothetical protein
VTLYPLVNLSSFICGDTCRRRLEVKVERRGKRKLNSLLSTFGSMSSFCKLYKSVVVGVFKKWMLKSEVRWTQ